MPVEVEDIQQRVASLTTAELYARRDDLERESARWARGAYGQPVPFEMVFEMIAIGAELRTRKARWQAE